MVEGEKVIAAKAHAEVLAAEADSVALKEVDNFAKQNYEQLVAAADGVIRCPSSFDQHPSIADNGASLGRHKA
jgi:hypothetical protein